MSENPTGDKPIELLKEYRGLNDQDDSVHRKPGNFTSAQNLYDSQADNVNRREGRGFVSLDDGNPIGVIFNLTWADGSNSIIQFDGSSASYNTFYYPTSFYLPDLNSDPCPDGVVVSCPKGSVASTNPNTGENYCLDPTTGDPICPPPDPTAGLFIPARKSVRPVPDFVPIIRALAEAYYFAKKGISAITIPTQTVGVNFKDKLPPYATIATGIEDIQNFKYYYNRGFVPVRSNSHTPRVPPQDLTQLPFDFYYVDYVMIGPARYSTDLNSIITIYNTIVLPEYLKTDPDSSPTVLNNYSSEIFRSVSTPANYKEVCAQFAATINNMLKRVKVAGTQASLETQTKTKQDTPATCGGLSSNCYKISGYSDTMFQSTCDEVCGMIFMCSGTFDGSFTFFEDDITVCWYTSTVGFGTGPGGIGAQYLSINGGQVMLGEFGLTDFFYEPGDGSAGFTIFFQGSASCPPFENSYIIYGKDTPVIGDPTGTYSVVDSQNATGPASITIVAC